MERSFYALISRMRYITRWGLMRNSASENVQEHSHMVAVIAHALALIRRDVFGGECDPNEAAALALYHDATEILTGDLPTPIKYHDGEINRAYKAVEALASERLLRLLPESLRGAYEPLLRGGEGLSRSFVKAADKIAAYIKCIEEKKAGSDEFLAAERQTLQAIHDMEMEEAEYFIREFIPAFELSLDELEN